MATQPNRRDFLRRCALLAAGNQLAILERLTHRKVFTTGGFDITRSTLAAWDEVVVMPGTGTLLSPEYKAELFRYIREGKHLAGTIGGKITSVDWPSRTISASF